jgi:hypothetical protein
MNNDTRWIVGTGVAIITAIVGTGAVLAGLLLTQMGAVHLRLDGLDDRLRAIEVGFGQIQQRLQTVEQRLQTVEQRLRAVGQRLLIIERGLLPTPTAPGE